ncbi:phosphatidylserine decarboxylase-domain-containing protein [Lophiotrema nucula]|uniref:Phosphatidylserine decarboxylase-domain-containing protein n=1 Tax=Lophiotrema nucula TaxID=690887 RepID=A0A6A5Z9Z4_9PLEO|nr:phosphatidylserine decarboxylase-domain-containing protein [Lophiotrema nucula]
MLSAFDLSKNTLFNMSNNAAPLPFSIPTEIDPWVQETFVDGVLEGNLKYLDEAIDAALKADIPQMQDWGITDSKRFLLFVSGMLYWTPSEIASGKLIYWTLCLFYFILDQKPLGIEPFSVPIVPTSKGKKYRLDQWIVDYAVKVGQYMDEPGSISEAAIASFQQSPLYHYDEAFEPPEGFKTFNKLFARTLKKGMRPISCPNDDSVVVYPADSTFDGAWHITELNDPHNPNSVLIASAEPDSLEVKYVPWPIADLLKDSKYADYFAGGQFMHAFLNTFDYHRQHSPVSGTVLEASVIQGLAYLNVVADNDGKLHFHRGLEPHSLVKKVGKGDNPSNFAGILDAPDNAGYQFLQTRGLIIIDNTLLGKVAVLPIGMAQVSSVKLIWEPDVTKGESYPVYPNAPIEKGDEISHFEFGGSDIVLVFEKGANLKVLGATGLDEQGQQTTKQKYLVGMPLGVSSNRVI